MQLAACTAEQFNHSLARLEQSLSIAKSITESALICSEGSKIEVVPQIIRIIEFFLKVTGRTMDEFQIIVLAGDLYDLFRTDTLDDVVLMFKMARTGEFGKAYGFDSMAVMDWARRYLDRKSAERERLASRARDTPGQKPGGGKYFHQLPAEMQEKFNAILSRDRQEPALLSPKGFKMMNEEKHRRTIIKLMNDDQD